MLLKGLSSLLHRWGNDAFVYAVLTGAAVTAAVGALFIRELPPSRETGEVGWLRPAARLHPTERRAADCARARRGAADDAGG